MWNGVHRSNLIGFQNVIPSKMRLAMIALAVFFCATAMAQARSSTENGIEWLRSAWATMQKQGPPAAERAVREFPDRFKGVPQRIQALKTRMERVVGSLKVEERKALLTELWRIRQCVDLLTLVEPTLLEQLVGIDVKTLRSATQELTRLRTRIG